MKRDILCIFHRCALSRYVSMKVKREYLLLLSGGVIDASTGNAVTVIVAS